MDEEFNKEQAHLDETYNKLLDIEARTRTAIEERMGSALADREEMVDALAIDLCGEVNVETYVEFEALHKIMDEYNLSNDLDFDRLAKTELLLDQPYFAKLTLQMKEGQPPRDIYIGATGMTDDMRRHFIIDWRSPVAEVYYNQAMGPTSYKANGRVINCDLKQRRQFDINGRVLNAYFDSSVAIEDPLLMQALSQQRSSKLSDITATIQREQNQVVRHDDVPVLLVNGIAGSGKTSVLLQRIAYLLYQQRENLNPKDVWLITPNKVFERYISDVLPQMGETNPATLTWEELTTKLGFGDRGIGKDGGASSLIAIDEGIGSLVLQPQDFRDIVVDDVRAISANQARSAYERYAKFPAGPHRNALVAEELKERLESRINQLANNDDMQARMSDLSDAEQIRIYGQYQFPETEAEVIDCTRKYVEDLFKNVEDMIEEGAWLRLERIGMHLLGKQSLTSAEMIYLKLALAGGGEGSARYVMIDEVQDYTEAQLMALSRYFYNAHFLLLGDQNQAIKEGCADFETIYKVFARDGAPVEEVRLTTSYRSSPEITALFARMADASTRMDISSVQRPGTEPVFVPVTGVREMEAAVMDAVGEAQEREGLCAVIAADKKRLKQLTSLLQDSEVTIVGKDAVLPDSGVILTDVAHAKGLEFDEVIIPDAGSGTYGTDDLSRHRLYTAISRATQRLTLIHIGEIAELLR